MPRRKSCRVRVREFSTLRERIRSEGFVQAELYVTR
jgi:hypothetical protein